MILANVICANTHESESNDDESRLKQEIINSVNSEGVLRSSTKAVLPSNVQLIALCFPTKGQTCNTDDTATKRVYVDSLRLIVNQD